MVAEEEALVGRVHHDRVVELAALIEPIDEPADVVVDGGDAAQVVLHVPLVLPERLPARSRVRRAGLLQVAGVEVVGDPHCARRAERCGSA